jgi:predicted nucleotidyltransferase component of viral defense system
MLQKNSVRKPLWDLLRDLQKSKELENYFLVGGTALSLQLGHRISDDIDLFTRTDIRERRGVSRLFHIYPARTLL